jgi:hypothetical protein
MSAASPELVIELRTEDSAAVLGCAPAVLGPIREDAAFRGVLAGVFPNDGRPPQFEIELRLAGAARDRVESIALRAADAPEARYPWTAFEEQALCLVERLIAERRLEPGTRSRWHLRPGAEAPAARRRPRARLRGEPYPLRDAALAAGRAPGAFEVAIAEPVLEAGRKQLLSGGSIESAALLLGRLYRDPRSGAARLVVLDQVELAPGRGGASLTHFALDARSFADAARVARARSGLDLAGWLHTHPACADCARKPECARDTVFFSTDDYQVHASAFARAYQVALVVGKLGDRPASAPGFRLYAWDAGRISELDFQVED